MFGWGWALAPRTLAPRTPDLLNPCPVEPRINSGLLKGLGDLYWSGHFHLQVT